MGKQIDYLIYLVAISQVKRFIKKVIILKTNVNNNT